MQAKWGLRTLERYRRLGLFRPNLYLVHMGWGNEAEADAVRDGGVKVCHCPSASIFHAMGCVREGMFPVMLGKGVPVCLGTDTVVSGRFLDMFRVMYLAACLHKEILLDARAVGAHKALEMATVEGARCLQWDDRIGSIEVGKEADILLLALDDIDWWPMVDLIGNVVYAVNGSCVDTVIVHGEPVLRGRKLVNVDEEDLIDRIKHASAACMARAGVRLPQKWPIS
jgi:5-methylthioadenosine/S-adenosylhomocysteine deaminase